MPPPRLYIDSDPQAFIGFKLQETLQKNFKRIMHLYVFKRRLLIFP